MTSRRQHRNRGFAAIIALLLVAVLVTISISLFTTASDNLGMSVNNGDAEQARLAAESGMRWISHRFKVMDKPQPTQGYIGGPYAWDYLWDDADLGLATKLKAELQNNVKVACTINGHALTTGQVALDGRPTGARFSISISQDPRDREPQRLYVTATGTCGTAVRRVRMDFWMDKKIRYAMIGRVPVQIGKNVLIQGPVAMSTTNYKNGQPGVLTLSDFKYIDGLRSDIEAFQAFYKNAYGKDDPNNKHDNCIPTDRLDLMERAKSKGWEDLNGDGVLNEYDVFLKQFGKSYGKDASGNPAISLSDWKQSISKTDTGLFTAIDQLLAPLAIYLDPATGQVLAQDPALDPALHPANASAAFHDGQLTNADGYAKILGQLVLRSADGLNPDLLQGPIINPDRDQPAVRIGTTPDEEKLFDSIKPETFSDTSDWLKQFAAAGTPSQNKGAIGSKVLTLDDAKYGTWDTVKVTNPGATGFSTGQVVSKADFDATNAKLSPKKQGTCDWAPTWAVEKTPYGSTTYQAIYKRPVFKDITFTDCQIPKGLNALFVNCKFKGVTFVETEAKIGTDDPTAAWNWVKAKTSGGTANYGTDVLVPAGVTPGSGEAATKGSTLGNNLRFLDCGFEGPIAGNNASAYTHCANSWEFNGDTVIENKWQDPNIPGSSDLPTETVMICSPQVNIEAGAYEANKTNKFLMKGVIVAGNFDVRGQGYIDGSIIVTGDGAGNTTLGYFGPSDSTTTDFNDADVAARSGFMIIRFNPKRALPNGIALPIEVLPDTTTYTEVTQ